MELFHGVYFARLFNRVPEVLSLSHSHATMQRTLSDYFSRHREMGGRDRRLLRSLVYANCRMGRTLPQADEKLRTAVGAYLVAELPWHEIVDTLRDPLLTGLPVADTLEKRIRYAKSLLPAFEEEALFPFSTEVSPALDLHAFRRSLLVPPRVFIRIRTGLLEKVMAELTALAIGFRHVTGHPNSLSFEPGTKLEALATFGEGCFEIQDFASQLVTEMYDPADGEAWWDVCAASGGKSLGLLDHGKDIRLVASDVRPAIVENLSIRIKRAGYSRTVTEVLDAAKVDRVPGAPFDAIVADVPCSGSGTWSRTPEHLSRFKTEEIRSKFVPLQQSILRGCVSRLKSNGRLFYSTCSVFEAENEGIVNWMVDSLGLRLVSCQYFSRYFDRADTLFSAVLAP